MNAGFSNLDTLRKHLLAKSQKGDTSFDLFIQTIGLGMAARIETFCNRKFARAVGWQEVQPGDRINFLLGKFPLEALTLVEVKLDEIDGWKEEWPLAEDGSVSQFINTIDLASGLIMLPWDNSTLDPSSRIRFTYTGGYWWEQLEPDDPAYPSAIPGTATPIPADLQLAWLLQCQQVWAARDKLGLSLVDKPEAQESLAALKMSPLVKEMLTSYVRNQMV